MLAKSVASGPPAVLQSAFEVMDEYQSESDNDARVAMCLVGTKSYVTAAVLVVTFHSHQNLWVARTGLLGATGRCFEVEISASSE